MTDQTDTPTTLPAIAEPAPQSEALFDRRMLEALICPVTHGELNFDAARQELISKATHLAFPIRGGIPIMLVSETSSLD